MSAAKTNVALIFGQGFWARTAGTGSKPAAPVPARPARNMRRESGEDRVNAMLPPR
jgi:hypothetical protein